MSAVGNIAEFTAEQLRSAFTAAVASKDLIAATGQAYVPNVDFTAAVNVLNETLQAGVSASLGLG